MYIVVHTTNHWCNSSLGDDMKSSKKGINRQALRGSSLCLRRFSASTLSLTRPTSLSSSSSNSSRAASSCSITSAIRRYWHSPRCPSASSLSGHQHVAHDRAEHRQFTATSAPSMLRESKYARHRRTCQFSFLVYNQYIHVHTEYIQVCSEYELVHTNSYKVQTGMY